jgi:hypothetical protein
MDRHQRELKNEYKISENICGEKWVEDLIYLNMRR